MKKFLTLLTVVAMCFAFLTGCSDPVFDDFENFLNVEMTDVNENYEKIKVEVGTWEELEDDAALESSLSDVLLPLVNNALDKLKDVKPETEEVKELKEKYIKMMNAYKDGFEEVLEGIREVAEDKVVNGSDMLSDALELLDDYNNALEKLAKEVDAEIEY